MTDLEIVLLCALWFMVFMYFRTERKLTYYRRAIVAVGLKKATVTVDEVDKTFIIEVNNASAVADK
jgi:hypothetical protein